MMLFKGSGVAISTPFTEDAINFDTFGKLIDFHLENGTDALIVCGTTGEPSTMCYDEKCSLIDFAVKRVQNRIPVIAGVGGNNTADVIKCAQNAKDSGANAVLAVTPYYNKCTRRGLIEHFLKLANTVDLPIMIYNVPSRTGVNLTADVFDELSEHKNIDSIKEACANISQIAEVARLTRNKATLYSGNDDHVVPVLSLGGMGVVSVLANIMPRYMHDMVMAYLEGDTQKACDMQLAVNPLANALFCEVNPIPVKTALRLMGFEMGPFRLPLTEMEEKNYDLLVQQLKDFKLI
ncbi:4-hydroxy-tetrahydrodipicolinate synthase [Christensenellaceae bacterium OttesenSCG-928-K19]|nr:4-hydroxy-tetrahydrodipicolinate synthase [Christensenellaceae bacterium OttesenSCG-928-K19]